MSSDQRYRGDLARRVADRLSLPSERVEDMLSWTERLQQICDEYETCRAAARQWRSARRTGESRLREFETLSVELETEAVRLLAERLECSP